MAKGSIFQKVSQEKKGFQKKEKGAADALLDDSSPSQEPSTLLIKKDVAWFDVKNSTLLPHETKKDQSLVPTVQQVDKLRREANGIISDQVKIFKSENKMSKSDTEWFKTVIKNGTASDKCSALTLAIQTCPLYNLEYLDGLMEIAKKPSRHESFLALDAIKDLFINGGLIPQNRKLLYLHQQQVSTLPVPSNKDASEQRKLMLLVWLFEDSIKRVYFEFVKIIEIIAQDQINYGRERACRMLYDLLLSNPFEQSTNILALLANKLGDPERKLASRIPFYFSELVNKYPKDLTLDTIEQIQAVIERSGVSDKTKYYALTFLVQIRLSRFAPQVITKLLQIYFGLFTKYIINNLEADSKNARKAKFSRRIKRIRHKREERGVNIGDEELAVPAEHSRIAKVILTGINRAFPFAASGNEELRAALIKFAPPLVNLCKDSVALATSIQALNLLLSIAPYDHQLKIKAIQKLENILKEEERLRVASSSHPLFIKTIGKAIKQLAESGEMDQVQRLLKALLQFTLAIISPGFAVAALLLVSEAFKKLPALRSMVNLAPETLKDSTENCLFELVPLCRHYHPRVKRFALSILNTGSIVTKPVDDQIITDPFENLSFSHFIAAWIRLDRIADGLSVPDELEFIQGYVGKRSLITLKKKDKKKQKEGSVDENSEYSDGEDLGFSADSDLEADADTVMEKMIENEADSDKDMDFDEEEDEEEGYDDDDNDDDDNDNDDDDDDNDDDGDDDDDDDGDDDDDDDGDDDNDDKGNDGGKVDQDQELSEPKPKRSKYPKAKKKLSSIFANASDFENDI